MRSMRRDCSSGDFIPGASDAESLEPDPAFSPAPHGPKSGAADRDPNDAKFGKSTPASGSDARSDSFRRTSQQALSPEGRKDLPYPWKAAMPEPYLLKSKICLVGEKGVGKTSLIRRYVLDQFDDKYVRTLGAKVEKKSIRVAAPGRNGVIDVSMAIWDIIGHSGFRQLLGDSFFNGAQGILAIADLTRRDTLPVLTGWVESVESVAGKVPVVLVANKADLVAEAQFGETELADMARTLDCTFLRASAKSGRNVEDAFLRLATQIAKARMPSNPIDAAKPS
jgi:small GTP-binding protein